MNEWFYEFNSLFMDKFNLLFCKIIRRNWFFVILGCRNKTLTLIYINDSSLF